MAITEWSRSTAGGFGNDLRSSHAATANNGNPAKGACLLQNDTVGSFGYHTGLELAAHRQADAPAGHPESMAGLVG